VFLVHVGCRDSCEAVFNAGDLPRRSSHFELIQEECEAGDDIIAEMDDCAMRKMKKRMNDMSKRKRISLFATATGGRAVLPTKHDYSISNIDNTMDSQSITHLLVTSKAAVSRVLSFLNESDLLTKITPVCKEWSDWATLEHANHLLTNVQKLESGRVSETTMERSWKYVTDRFPWACFLAEGGAKKVYKAFNSIVKMEEAVSVM
jgi:hypothetical protein